MTIERLLEFYKELRPKPHNRNTLIILFCGASLLANPLWLSVVAALLQKYFRLELSSLQGEATISGIALIIIGALYHYFSEKLLAASRANSENDNLSATKFWKIYDEGRLKGITDHDLWNGFIETKDDDYLDNLLRYLRATENLFTAPLVEKARESLRMACNELVKFNAYNFFYRRGFPKAEIRYLYPDLNFELDGEYNKENIDRFDTFLTQLRNKIEDFDSALKRFVIALKRQDLIPKNTL